MCCYQIFYVFSSGLSIPLGFTRVYLSGSVRERALHGTGGSASRAAHVRRASDPDALQPEVSSHADGDRGGCEQQRQPCLRLYEVRAFVVTVGFA